MKGGLCATLLTHISTTAVPAAAATVTAGNEKTYQGSSACIEHDRVCNGVEGLLALDCTEEKVRDKTGVFANHFLIDMSTNQIFWPTIEVYELQFEARKFKVTTDNICWGNVCIGRADLDYYSTFDLASATQCRITDVRTLLSPYFEKIETAKLKNQF